MSKSILFLLVAFISVFAACSDGQSQTSPTRLPAKEFAEKIKQTPDALILDVRTPDEYAKGHLENALNYDWNGDVFDTQIAEIEKSRPVFVYCLSGGRSSAAAQKMRADGFKNVYELQGGIMKWRAANLPETKSANTSAKGMTQQQFNQLINSDKLVLVDFYADWCGSCKKMKPSLDEIAREMPDKVIVIRINADDNSELCRSMHIDALPILHLYKNNELIWVNEGYIDKENIIAKLQ